MAIVVVGGGAKDLGKTALVCGVIAALREFDWTAVKITGHEYEPGGGSTTRQVVWEETHAGQKTDTARYLAAGARRALLVSRAGVDLPINEIRRALADDRNIIFESNRIVEALRPDLCLALVGGAGSEWKASFVKLLKVADALVSTGEAEAVPAGTPPGILRFRLESADRLTPEMVSWLRERLGSPLMPQ